MTDAYANWRKRLAGEDVPIHDGQPECGRYKMRRGKNGPFHPVAIFLQNGEMKAAVGKEFVDPDSIWLHAVKNPISESDYKHALQHGHFPDEPPPRTAIGGNSPPETIDELIPLEIEAAGEWLKSIGEIKSQQDADIAGNRVSELRRLKKEAETAHATEKKPILEEGRKIDGKWKPLISSVDDAVKALLNAVNRWGAAERARLAREAEEARKKAEADAEAKRREASSQGLPEPEDVPLPLEPTPPPKIQVGGARGAKIGFRTETIAVIENYQAALAHFAEHEDIKSCVQKLAQRAAKAGMPVPGVKIEKVQKAA